MSFITPSATTTEFYSETGFTATWDKVDANGYLLYVSENGAFSTHISGYEGLDVGDVSEHDLEDLVHGKNYYYRVKAYNSTGQTDYSNTMVVTTIDTGTTVVFIDPDYTGITSDGNYYTPYKSWSNIGQELNSNTTYLQKRNTVDSSIYKLIVDEQNIIIGGYGSGEKPEFCASGTSGIGLIIRGYTLSKNITVRDMCFYPARERYHRGMYILGVNGGDLEDLYFKNLEIKNFYTGIMCEPYSGNGAKIRRVNFHNLHIHDCGSDGILAKSISGVTMTYDHFPLEDLIEYGKTNTDWSSGYTDSYNLFYNNNQNWFQNYGSDGDDIHFTWNYHDSTLVTTDNIDIQGIVSDRRLTGHKGNFIVNFTHPQWGTGWEDYKANLVIKDFLAYPPRTGGDIKSGATAIFYIGYGARTTFENIVLVGDSRLHDVNTQRPASCAEIQTEYFEMNNSIIHKLDDFGVSISNQESHFNHMIFTISGLTHGLEFWSDDNNLTNCIIAYNPDENNLYNLTQGDLSGITNTLIYSGETNDRDDTIGWTDWFNLNYRPTINRTGDTVGSMTADIFDQEYIGNPSIGSIEYQDGIIVEAPTATTATNITYSGFTANWLSTSATTGYYLYVSENSGFTTHIYNKLNVGNVTSYIVSNLSEETDYFYRIKSYNNNSISDYSNIISATTQDLIYYTYPPTATTASVITWSGFTSNWIKSSNATGYRLVISDNSGFTSVVTGYDHIDVGDVDNYEVYSSQISGSSLYFYKLLGYSLSGYSYYSNITGVTTTETPIFPPDIPSATAATNIHWSGFTANWFEADNATGYTLDVSTNSSFTYFVLENLDVGNVTNYTVSKEYITRNTYYWYRLQSYNSLYTSDHSNSISLYTESGYTNERYLDLDGYNGVLYNTNLTDYAHGKSKISFSVWVNFTDTHSNDVVMGWQYNFNNLIKAEGDYIAGILQKGIGETYSVTSGTLNDGVWHHIALTYENGSGMTLYVDNSIVDTNSAMTGNIHSFGDNEDFAIGAYYHGTSNNYFSGKVDEAAVFEKRLSESEVSKLYGNGYPTGVGGLEDIGDLLIAFNFEDDSNFPTIPDLSSNGYDGTLQNVTIDKIKYYYTHSSPTATTATNIHWSGFTSNWVKSINSSGYYLYVSEESDFSTHVTGYNQLDVGDVDNYLVSELTGNTDYYYKLKAYGTGFTSDYSNTISVTTEEILDAESFDTPTATTATNIGYTGFTANWTGTLASSGYTLYVSTNPSFSSHVTGYDGLDVGDVSTFEVYSENIFNNTDYYYRLKAYAGVETTEYSNTINLTTLKNPDAPTATTATNISYDSFTANWDLVDVASGYTLDVSTNESFTSLVYENYDVGNVSSYSVDSNINENTDYYYRLKAYTSGATSDYSNEIALTTILSPPDAPTATTATNISQLSFDANWLEVSEIIEEYNGTYYLDVSDSPSFSSYVPGWQNVDCGIVTTRSVDSNLEAEIQYFYRVRAENDYGLSENSNTISLVTLPFPPGVPNEVPATNISHTGFTANWNSPNPSPDDGIPTGYKIDVSTESNFSTYLDGYQKLDVGLILHYDIDNLNDNTNYYYRVYAYNDGGESSESDTISLTTLKEMPLAMFYSDVNVVLTGQTINFYDTSTNLPTSWSWTFEGGTPSALETQNASVVYYSAGTFDVSLTVSNNMGTDDEEKIGYIRIYDSPLLADYQVLKFNNRILRSSSLNKILMKGSSENAPIQTFDNLYYITTKSSFGQYIDSNELHNFKSGESFAFGCYFKTKTSSLQYILSKGFNEVCGNYWIRILNGTVGVGLNFSGDTGGIKADTPTNTYNDDNWYHVMGVLNLEDNQLQLYINAIKVGYYDITSDIINNIHNNENFRACRQTSTYFDGSVDEIVLVKGDVDAEKINGLAGMSITNCGDATKVFTDNDLLVYYRLEEGQGSTTENLGTGSDGSIVNNPTWSSH